MENLFIYNPRHRRRVRIQLVSEQDTNIRIGINSSDVPSDDPPIPFTVAKVHGITFQDTIVLANSGYRPIIRRIVVPPEELGRNQNWLLQAAKYLVEFRSIKIEFHRLMPALSYCKTGLTDSWVRLQAFDPQTNPTWSSWSEINVLLFGSRMGPAISPTPLYKSIA